MSHSTSQVHSGCSVCRSRKVKCDRGTPSCRNCDRLRVKCPGLEEISSYPSLDHLHHSVESIYRASGVERRRVGSCEECRRSKSRCSRTRPICRRCTQKQLECHYSFQPDSRRGTEHCTSPKSTSRTFVTIALGEPSADLQSRTTGTGFEWLFADAYPQIPSSLGLLVKAYFDRISTLRCLGFIHKPSFLKALDRGSLKEEYGEALICIISALGAKVYYREAIDEHPELNLDAAPGFAWAEKAQFLAMREIGCPTLTTLMTLILICEYALSTDQHALAFVIMGCCYRTLRLLGLDSPKRPAFPQAPSAIARVESERRLVWSCYILDSFIGGGVDGNLEWTGDPPRIPLPCPDHNFIAQTRSTEQYLPTTETLQDLPSLNLQSQIIYLVSLRTRALRLIRNGGQSVDVSNHLSPFLTLIRQLETWYTSLSDQWALSDLNIYVQKELNIISGVFMLHFLYHSIACDLTRISLAGFDFPLASALQKAPTAFREQVQERCRFHADEVSRLVRAGLGLGRIAFDDQHCAITTFESTKIQIVYTATTSINNPLDRQRASDNIRVNLKMLSMVQSDPMKTNQYHQALLPLLSKFGFHNIVSEWQGQPHTARTRENTPEVSGPADVSYLSNAAPFRLAQSNVEAQAEARDRRVSSTARSDATASLMASQPPAISPTQVPTANDESWLSTADMINMPLTGDIPSTKPGTLEGVAAPIETPGLSVEEYVRIASEMSSFITEDLSQLPSWSDIEGVPADWNM